jgi:hypothetical protein
MPNIGKLFWKKTLEEGTGNTTEIGPEDVTSNDAVIA